MVSSIYRFVMTAGSTYWEIIDLFTIKFSYYILQFNLINLYVILLST